MLLNNGVAHYLFQKAGLSAVLHESTHRNLTCAAGTVYTHSPVLLVLHLLCEAAQQGCGTISF
jgi:hypothetical protein